MSSISLALQQETLTPFGHALAGALGGVFSNSIVYPLDTIKTRLQGLDDDLPVSTDAEGAKRTRTKKGILVLLLKIYKEEGLTGFFKGFGANMLNTFSMQFAYFYFHTFLRSLTLRRLSRSRRAPITQLSTPTELLLGALAGCLAQVFTIPVAVIATRQQLFVRGSKTSPDPGFLETGREIIAESGVQGLWTGLKPGLVLTVNPAITYGVFERVKGALIAQALQKGGEGKLSAVTAFGLGMGSKTLATVVTYPYIFAKVRLQAKSSAPPPPILPTTTATTTTAPSYAAIAAQEPLSAHHDPSSGAVATSSDLTANTAAVTSTVGGKRMGALDVLRQTYERKGLGGWYQGMQAQVLKAMLSQGILFMAKGQLERYALLLMILARRMTAA